MKGIKKIGRFFRQYRHLIILVIVIALAIAYLCSDPSGRAAQRRCEKQKIENQIRIEKAQTDKELAIIEAEMEAEVTRIKSGVSDGSAERQ